MKSVWRGQAAGVPSGPVVHDGDFVASQLSWMRIIAFRRRDRLAIVPMSLLATIGAWVWLGPGFAVAWLLVNMLMIAGSWALCDVAGRQRAPARRWELLVALASAAQTTAYCSLPFALIVGGSHTALAGGLAMMGAIALSAADEFVISRRIGAASLIVSFITVISSLAWLGGVGVWAEILLVLLAVCGFFTYALQAAFKRRNVERQMALALQAAIEKETEAAVANAAKSTFLATISHEIRTPLNGVLGMAQAMSADHLSDAQRGRLCVIQRSGEALTEILNDVLDLSKIEAGRLEIEIVEFELRDVLQASIAAFAPGAAAKGLDLRLEMEEGAPGAYRGDPLRLRQVLYNLISNAVKFAPRGEVRVVAARVGGVVQVAVSDTGPGIPEAQQARLFRKFEQLDATTTRRHGGTGLGLAICRELCELMGGTISVKSSATDGSIFTVTLPLERVGDRLKTAAVPDEPAQSASMTLRILAAEDNEVNRTVLTALLAQIGVAPTIVEDGAQAVAAWESAPWDLILMDIQMPVMDGVSAVREIRARERATGRPRTPVIALTANAMVHQVADLKAAGMDDHVSKPIKVAQLFEAIAMAAGGLDQADDEDARSAG
jgi:signal transduction histidine kinase/CheY-like chemotaxis protein